MRYTRIALIFIVLVLSGCNLSSQPPTAEPLDVPTTDAGGRPVVIITSPQNGDEVGVGTQIFVTAQATDAVGVTRVQLLANSQIVKTVSSESAAGQRNAEFLLDYTPRQAGEVNLQVVAYRNAIASDPAAVTINVKSTQALVTATLIPIDNAPIIDPNDPTCRVLTTTGLNLRGGPGTNYDRLTVLAAGVQAPIIGRLGDNTWWQIRYGINAGWVSAQYTSVYGLCSSVPVIVSPPTPTTTASTPTPTATATRAATLTPTITATPGKADLVISSIGGPTSTTVAASPVTYSVTITNTGSGPSGTFVNKVTLPDGTDGDLGAVSNLNAGESIILNIAITFTAAAPYTLQARVDTANQVIEVSEVNNSGSLPVSVS